jgi:hypothetical protein
MAWNASRNAQTRVSKKVMATGWVSTSVAVARIVAVAVNETARSRLGVRDAGQRLRLV